MSHEASELMVALEEWKDAGAHVSTVVAAIEQLVLARFKRYRVTEKRPTSTDAPDDGINAGRSPEQP